MTRRGPATWLASSSTRGRAATQHAWRRTSRPHGARRGICLLGVRAPPRLASRHAHGAAALRAAPNRPPACPSQRLQFALPPLALQRPTLGPPGGDVWGGPTPSCQHGGGLRAGAAGAARRGLCQGRRHVQGELLAAQVQCAVAAAPPAGGALPVLSTDGLPHCSPAPTQHFLGHLLEGWTDEDGTRTSAQTANAALDLRDLRDTLLPPFQACARDALSGACVWAAGRAGRRLKYRWSAEERCPAGLVHACASGWCQPVAFDPAPPPPPHTHTALQS